MLHAARLRAAAVQRQTPSHAAKKWWQHSGHISLSAAKILTQQRPLTSVALDRRCAQTVAARQQQQQQQQQQQRQQHARTQNSVIDEETHETDAADTAAAAVDRTSNIDDLPDDVQVLIRRAHVDAGLPSSSPLSPHIVSLYRQQIHMEHESQYAAMERMAESIANVNAMGRGSQMSPGHTLFMHWYPPVHDAVVAHISRQMDTVQPESNMLFTDQPPAQTAATATAALAAAHAANKIKAGNTGSTGSLHGFKQHNYLRQALPLSAQIAAITINNSLNSVLSNGGAIDFVSIAEEIGSDVRKEIRRFAVEAVEAKIARALSSMAGKNKKNNSSGSSGSAAATATVAATSFAAPSAVVTLEHLSLATTVTALRAQLQRIHSAHGHWGDEGHVRVGAVLLNLLIQNATIPPLMLRDHTATDVSEAAAVAAASTAVGATAAKTRSAAVDSKDSTPAFYHQIVATNGGIVFQNNSTAAAKTARSSNSSSSPSSSRKSTFRKKGELAISPLLFRHLTNLERDNISPSDARYKPMITTPRPWSAYDTGGYITAASKVMRSKGHRIQLEAARGADLTQLFAALNYLGRVPWSINQSVMNVVEELWSAGGGVASIPTRADIPLPVKPTQPMSVDSSAANGEQWQQYRRSLDRVKQSNRDLHSLRSDLTIRLQQAREFRSRSRFYFPYNIDFRGRVYPMPVHLNHQGTDLARGLLQFSERKRVGEKGLRWLKIQAANLFGINKRSYEGRVEWTEEHLQQCVEVADDPLSKLWVMQASEETTAAAAAAIAAGTPVAAAVLPIKAGYTYRWFLTADDPFQFLAACLDLTAALRSPVPSDYESCQPLHVDGSCNGLQHYAAMGRDQWGGSQVNLTPSDKPQDVYQAVCDEVNKKITAIVAAADNKQQQNIQITRDNNRAAAANAKETDSNVTPIAMQPLLLLHADEARARVLEHKINRKIIKQTVMTTVYGVTAMGARAQVQARLVERTDIQFPTRVLGTATASTNTASAAAPAAPAAAPEQDERVLQEHALFVSRLTQESLGDLFSGARHIMDWLLQCGALISAANQPVSWVTPLNLPVVQPYRQNKSYIVHTEVQSVSIADKSDLLPVSTREQKTALPPNFVHSLDATHMLMTALACQQQQLCFAAVHDSYWSHACDIDEVGDLLREEFVALYERPILQDLRQQWATRFPFIQFPQIPTQRGGEIKQQTTAAAEKETAAASATMAAATGAEGEQNSESVAAGMKPLDLNSVLRSPYFFS